ncbi:MAG: hypothetical protein LV481_06160 [Methylacidiphilales bacterium]|nr:hypothetical protein [Candidatus Methylacidiphilales bacterium]
MNVTTSLPTRVAPKDREILRSLAARVREIAESPEQGVRRRRLTAHNALRPERPIILAYPEGAWVELLPATMMQCKDEKLRGWEYQLRCKIYWWEHLRDDNALEPFFNIGWHIRQGDYGFNIAYEYGANRGSYHWVPPLEEIEAGFDKLKSAVHTVDREGTYADVALADELFGDLLPAHIHGKYWWTSGLTWEAIKLIGLETLMLAPYDQPEGLHRLMGFLRDEHLNFLAWMETEGLLSDTNEDDYVGSGGVAYTDELPQGGRQLTAPVRLRDTWGFAESQETVGVSPAMFTEFILPYQLPILEKFGLNCYGCCEPLHDRIDPILKVAHLRRVSVSPWCDQKIMAEKLGRNYVFSRKPNPTQICIMFNEENIRKDLAETLALAGKGSLEIIMKDTATVQNEPWRISRWIEIALEEVHKYSGD